MSPDAVRSSLGKSLDRSHVVILCSGLLLAFIQAAMIPRGGPVPPYLWMFPVVVLSYFGAGVRAWHLRPSNHLGMIMVYGGFAVFLGGLVSADNAVLATAGGIGATLVLSVMVHLLHAFPSGRVHGRISKTTVAAAYVNSLLLQAPGYLFVHDGPAPALFIVENSMVSQTAQLMQSLLGAAIMAATAFVLVRRLRQADGPRRRSLAPLYAYGAFAVLFVPLGANVLAPLLNMTPEGLMATQLVVVGGIPLAFAHGILRGGFAKTGELEELGSWLSSAGGTRPALAAALSRALGDPSLALSFWVPRHGVFVTGDGDIVAPAAPQPDRGTVKVTVEGRTVGAINYDSSLIAEPELVRTAGQVVAIAVDRERLTAELRESHGALQRSRERLVDAADRERRRIAQDLHDGLQMHLVLLALEAQKLANAAGTDPGTSARATQLRHGIDSAAADLRQLVHAVMPAALIERGLSAAAEDLADRLPIPTTLELDLAGQNLPSAVESTAYFVLAEALTNAVKHSQASSVRVRIVAAGGWLLLDVTDDGVGRAGLHGGTGLRGIADRADVMGGTFTLASRPDEGTKIVVELPCG